MLTLDYRTKGNASPQGRSKVFFTCHPADLERSLDRLCADLFALQDAAVYYTADMTAQIGPEDRTVQLEQMNLFVVPVSRDLLTAPNRAMDEDVPFAMEKHIPVLPVLLEPGLEAVYSRPDRFGTLQYLDPNDSDSTAIPYEEKLKRYLESTLIDDKTAERVRKAFDAYIFLSYRKKDRRYANELMRLIHADPVCRDLAIWYDEYLTPGESFSDAIEAALGKSELFALLVTPNLVNEDNYVQTTEYPAALESGKEIFPVEAVATDRLELEAQYPGIPACSVPEDEGFRARLLEALRHVALQAHKGDPAHNYLIGLAYMEGIDVEVDRARALELITDAGEAGLAEAMQRLSDMYRSGSGVQLDYREAAKWAERLVEQYRRRYGERNLKTMRSMSRLAGVYMSMGRYADAERLNERVLELRKRVLGMEEKDTLGTMINLASSYYLEGRYDKAERLYKQAIELQKRALGPEHPTTLMSFTNLANVYRSRGRYDEAERLYEQTLAVEKRVLGEEHPQTLSSMQNLAVNYQRQGRLEDAERLLRQVLEIRKRVLGEEHPSVVKVMAGLANNCFFGKRYEEAAALHEPVLEIRRRVLGEEHPDTLTTMNNLANTYRSLHRYEEAGRLYERTLEIRRRVLGEEHPQTLTSLHNCGVIYYSLHRYEEAVRLQEQAYELRKKVLGETHPETQASKKNLAVMYRKLGRQGDAERLG